jgi:diamine N-acetyltransferase
MTEPVIWLRGTKAGLGPLSKDLVEDYWRWDNDPAVILGYGRQTPESLESREQIVDSQLRNTSDQIRFTVYLLNDPQPQPVGLSSLLIDHQVRTAEYVIQLGSEGRGQGIGAEATWLTLDYAFHLTHLRMVWLKVLAENTAGIRAYENAGFQNAGRLRQSGYWLGQPCDEIIMDALPSDLPGESAVRRLFRG